MLETIVKRRKRQAENRALRSKEALNPKVRMVVGPKVGPAEPACINDPNTGELITNKESIK